jgi:hypothetical protein
VGCKYHKDVILYVLTTCVSPSSTTLMVYGISITQLAVARTWTCSVRTCSKVSQRKASNLNGVVLTIFRWQRSLPSLLLPRHLNQCLGYRRQHRPFQQLGQLLRLVLHVQQSSISLYRTAHIPGKDRYHESPLHTDTELGEERRSGDGRSCCHVLRRQDLSGLLCQLLLDSSVQSWSAYLEWQRRPIPEC